MNVDYSNIVCNGDDQLCWRITNISPRPPQQAGMQLLHGGAAAACCTFPSLAVCGATLRAYGLFLAECPATALPFRPQSPESCFAGQSIEWRPAVFISCLPPAMSIIDFYDSIIEYDDKSSLTTLDDWVTRWTSDLKKPVPVIPKDAVMEQVDSSLNL